MKKVFMFVLIGVLIILAMFTVLKFAVKENPTVPFETARATAQERVEALNTPYGWNYVDSVLVYDSRGNPGRYYFLFVKEESNITVTGFGDVEKLITNVTECYLSNFCNNNFATEAIRAYENPTGRGDRNLYGLTRHYRGIPSFMAEKMEIEQAVYNKYLDKKFGRLVVLLESTMEPVYYTLIDKNQDVTNGPLSKSAELVIVGNYGSFKIETLGKFLQGSKNIAEEMSGASLA